MTVPTAAYKLEKEEGLGFLLCPTAVLPTLLPSRLQDNEAAKEERRYTGRCMECASWNRGLVDPSLSISSTDTCNDA